MTARIDAIRAQVSTHEVDAALLTRLTDIRWAVGFSGSNGILIVRPEDVHFVTDGRYAEQAHEEVDGATIHVPGYKLYKHVEKSGLFGEARTVLCQSDDITIDQYEELRSRFSGIEWHPVSHLLRERVASKTLEEIDRLRRAQKITDQVFTDIVSLIRPGVTEREIAAEIVYRHIREGADRVSFDPIVAAGRNGARPHARPTDRSMRRGDLVTIDMGCFAEGYASDMTRTVALGDPGDDARQLPGAIPETVGLGRRPVDRQRLGVEPMQVGPPGRDVPFERLGVVDVVVELRLRVVGVLQQLVDRFLARGVGLDVLSEVRWRRLAADERVLKIRVLIDSLPNQYSVRINEVEPSEN
jgi:Xaa-Pro aminopeptidase